MSQMLIELCLELVDNNYGSRRFKRLLNKTGLKDAGNARTMSQQVLAQLQEIREGEPLS